MSKKSFFFDGFMFGAISGVILGVLFAPQSGEETRSKIKDFKEENEDLIKKTKDNTEQLIEKTKDAIETGFDKLSHIIENNVNKSKTSKATSKTSKKKY